MNSYHRMGPWPQRLQDACMVFAWVRDMQGHALRSGRVAGHTHPPTVVTCGSSCTSRPAAIFLQHAHRHASEAQGCPLPAAHRSSHRGTLSDHEACCVHRYAFVKG